MDSSKNFALSGPGLIGIAMLLVLGGCSSPSDVEENQTDPPASAAPSIMSDIVVSSGDASRTLEVHREVTAWMNDVTTLGEYPPVPTAEAWQDFAMTTGGEEVVFKVDDDRELDVLEILTYPEGLDAAGEPISTVVNPMCGPQAAVSCRDASSSDGDVRIAAERLAAAVEGIEYYAVGGVVLHDARPEPEGFMVLVKNAMYKA